MRPSPGAPRAHGMSVVEAVLSRRSVGRLLEPAPSEEELLELLAVAMRAPDHGLLRPWRLILLEGSAREALGAAFADGEDGDDARVRAAAKPLRAPLLVSVVLSPRPSPKVPEWEQLAATAGMVHSLVLLLHAAGWSSMWRTGGSIDSPRVRRLLGLAPQERLLGWLYVGTADPARPPGPRPPVDASSKAGRLVAYPDGRTAVVACRSRPASGPRHLAGRREHRER